jgi:hypothetical protein
MTTTSAQGYLMQPYPSDCLKKKNPDPLIQPCPYCKNLIASLLAPIAKTLIALLLNNKLAKVTQDY